jgi:lipopolysaccharide transport system permease protein
MSVTTIRCPQGVVVSSLLDPSLSADLSQKASENTPAPNQPELAQDLPLTVIEPRSDWHLLDLRELWRYRELLVMLAWRDISIRFKQTILGFTWALAQPLATLAVFVIFFGRMGGLDSGVDHYPLFVFAAILPWTFFANSITAAGNSIVANERLVTKVYFPRIIVPLSALGAPLFDFLIASGILVCMMFWYGVAPGWNILLAPFIFAMLMVAAAGVGIFLSALIVSQRDFRFILTFGVQLWMFATCIFLPPTALGPKAYTWGPLNPAFGLIWNLRDSMLGGTINWYSLGVSSAVSVALLLVGLLYFRRVERSFADVI